MKNKSLIILFALIIFLFTSTISLADNLQSNSNNTGNDIVDGITSVGDKLRDFGNSSENVVEDAVDDAGNLANDTGKAIQNTYNAVKTSTTDSQNVNNMTSSLAWVIVAIEFAVIIGLIWYYLAQTKTYNE